jgi:hypothetical protein
MPHEKVPPLATVVHHIVKPATSNSHARARRLHRVLSTVVEPPRELWRLYFVGIGEVAIYCPDCSEREFRDSSSRSCLNAGRAEADATEML